MRDHGIRVPGICDRNLWGMEVFGSFLLRVTSEALLVASALLLVARQLLIAMPLLLEMPNVLWLHPISAPHPRKQNWHRPTGQQNGGLDVA